MNINVVNDENTGKWGIWTLSVNDGLRQSIGAKFVVRGLNPASFGLVNCKKYIQVSYLKQLSRSVYTDRISPDCEIHVFATLTKVLLGFPKSDWTKICQATDRPEGTSCA